MTPSYLAYIFKLDFFRVLAKNPAVIHLRLLPAEGALILNIQLLPFQVALQVTLVLPLGIMYIALKHTNLEHLYGD